MLTGKWRRRRPDASFLSMTAWSGFAFAVIVLSACSVMDNDPPPTATPGDQFVVVTAAAGQNDAPSFTYIVREGDTLSGIADFTGASESELISLNHLGDPNAIYVGQELLVPTPSP